MSKKGKKLPTNVIPSTLKWEHIKPLLFDDNGVKDQELAEFTKSFCHRLAEYNPKRDSFPREQEARRFDAMARLLVGNEICAAVSFDDKNLLIATNKISHSENVLHVRTNILIKEEVGTNQYQVNPIIYIALNDSIPTRIEIDKYSTHYLRKQDQTLNLAPNSPSIIEFVLSPEQHKIPNLRKFTITSTIEKKISLAGTTCDKFKRDIFLSNGQGKEIFAYEDYIPENSLSRRADTLAKYLANIVLLKQSEEQIEEKELLLLKDVIKDYRHIVLMNSLAWEASYWYKKNVGAQDRFYLNSKVNGISKFISIMNENFSEFKLNYNNNTNKVRLVNAWGKELIQKIKDNKICIENFLKEDIESFIKKASKYFVDLIKLEEFFEVESSKNSILAQLFMKYDKPDSDKKLIKIIDHHEDGVHCEIRILCYYLQQGGMPKYIATSLLCCAYCKLVMDSLKIEIIDTDSEIISGTHARTYGNWILPSFLKDNDKYLELFLGDSLYELLQKLKNVNTVCNEKSVSKADLALKIIENIASLDKEALKKLDPNLKPLWNNEKMQADESDDETDNDNIEKILDYQQGKLQDNKDFMSDSNLENSLTSIKETELLAEETPSVNDLS
jgi:hypothetical protein